MTDPDRPAPPRPYRRRGGIPLARALVGRYVPFRARQAFFWDLQAGFSAGVFAGLIVPFAAVIAVDQLGANAFEISILATAPYVGMLLSAPAAQYSEGRRKVPLVALIYGFARLLIVPAALFPHALAFVALIGLSFAIGALALPAYAAVMQQVYPAGQRAALIAIIRVAAVSGTLLGSLAGGPLIEAAGFRPVFLVAVVVGMWGIYAFSRIRTREQPAEARRRGFGYRESVQVLRDDALFRHFSVAFFIFGFANIAATPLYPLFMVRVLHITPVWVGLLAAVGAAVSGVTFYGWGRFIDRRGPYRASVWSFGLMALALLVYAGATRVEMLLLASLFGGLALPAIELAWLNATADRAGAEAVTRYTGVHFTLVGVRGMTAPLTAVSFYRLGLSMDLEPHVSLRILFVGLTVLSLVAMGVMASVAARRRWGHETPRHE